MSSNSNISVVKKSIFLPREAFLTRSTLFIALALSLAHITPSIAFDAPTGVRAPAIPTLDRSALETFVDDSVHAAMQRDDIAGVGVAIVDDSGPLLIKSYGLAGADRSVDADTLFSIQSISKTLVWIALMQLVERGQISLKDPINGHLPNSLKVPEEGFGPILVQNLIDHTAGFEDSALGHLFVDRPEKLLPLNEYLAHFQVHRVREPGTAQVYSNYGAALGGALVAHVSGMTWEDYAEQRIIRPLGMSPATYRQDYSAELAEKLGLPAPMPATSAALQTEGFRRGAAGLEIAPREFTADFPAGSLAISSRSMGVYMRALLNPGVMAQSGVLKAETLLTMRSSIFKGPAGFGDMRFGFEPFALPGDIEAFGHGGDSIYQVSSMTLIPSRSLGIFVSANTASGRTLVMTLRQKLVAEFFDSVLTPAQYRADSVAEARSYAGHYRNLRRPYFRTEHGIYDLVIASASVTAQPNGDIRVLTLLNPPRLLVPMGAGVYRDENGPDRIAFRPLNGKIGMYDPFVDTAWERIGFFASPNFAFWTIALTALAAVLCIGGAFRRIRELRRTTGVRHYATAIVTVAAVFWVAGFTFLGSFFAKGLTSRNTGEIIWWYPSTALVCACWIFAAAAALTLAAIPSLVLVTRFNDWSAGRKIVHALSVSVFLVCSATFLHLGFIGFTGW